VGGGAVASGAREQVSETAERLAAPVIETYMARGIMRLDHEWRVGFPPHLRSVGGLWDDADAVLAIGSDLDGMMTQNWKMPAPPALVSINVLQSEIDKAYPADVALVGDASVVLAQLLSILPRESASSGASARMARTLSEAKRELAQEDQSAVTLLDDLRAVVPADTPIAADMCIAGYWVAGFRDFAEPRRLAYPMGWGTLGFAFPASIGMALRHGPTLCVCGDGGFLFAAGELAVLAERRPPLTILIVNDHGYGMLRYDQVSAGRRSFGVDLVTPDFVALARSFGLSAEHVEGLGDGLRQALHESLSRAEPSVLVLDAALGPPPTTSPRWFRKESPS
jgi:thiamine pyrophosphate-dependent acetolactate synthase large subunit-like protein